MRIEVGPRVPLAPRDTLVLASDGLWDNLVEEEVIDRLRKGPLLDALRETARAYRSRMLAPKGRPDDLVLLTFRPQSR